MWHFIYEVQQRMRGTVSYVGQHVTSDTRMLGSGVSFIHPLVEIRCLPINCPRSMEVALVLRDTLALKKGNCSGQEVKSCSIEID